MRTLAIPTFAVLALSAGLAGCSSDDMGKVSLQLATRRTQPMASVMAAPGQLTVSLGSDEIVIDAIQLVLRKIRLDGAPAASCPEDGDGSACAEVRLGPVVVDLPLEEGADQVFTAVLPVGSYDRLRFQLHKPSNANEDADLVAEHPEMEDVSIRVTGTFNGTAFVYTSDLTEVEEVTMTEPIEVASEGEAPLTLHVDASRWFENVGGAGLVDPAQANDGEPFESLVEQNIRASFRAFHDGDADGAAD